MFHHPERDDGSYNQVKVKLAFSQVPWGKTLNLKLPLMVVLSLCEWCVTEKALRILNMSHFLPKNILPPSTPELWVVDEDRNESLQNHINNETYILYVCIST